jgi:hypothetical protein
MNTQNKQDCLMVLDRILKHTPLEMPEYIGLGYARHLIEGMEPEDDSNEAYEEYTNEPPN